MSHRNVEFNLLNNDLVNLQASTKLAVMLVGRDLAIRRFSPQAEALLELLLADVGRPIDHVRHGLVLGDAPGAPLDLGQLASEVMADVRERECEIRDKSGRWHLLRVRPYLTLDNKVEGAVLVWVDIDTLKRKEGELRLSEEKLRDYNLVLSEADGRKNEFLAMLGHELRNPLAAIAYGLQLLSKVVDEPTRVEEVRGMMTRQTERFTAMLDQLLDVSRVISGKVEIAKGPVVVADVIRSGVEAVRPLLESRKHTLTLALPSEGSPLVMGDPIRLTQVVENLVGNAAKYTDEGGQIQVALVSDEGLERSTIRITVSDTGMGIDAELLPHVFEVFTQGKRTLDRAKGGLGLGLPLVQLLVALHGGKVDAASPGVGQGSTFTVTLPLLMERRGLRRPNGDPVLAAARQAQPRAHRILVVDDESTGEILAELLGEEGHQTLAVHDGPAALAAVRTFDPEVVLLDLGLPHMDGYEVARRLRQENPDKRILLIAVTGYQKDAGRLNQAGFDQHLLKPPNLQRLSTFLATWSDGQAAIA